jgi:hypothetical protein
MNETDRLCLVNAQEVVEQPLHFQLDLRLLCFGLLLLQLERSQLALVFSS